MFSKKDIQLAGDAAAIAACTSLAESEATWLEMSYSPHAVGSRYPMEALRGKRVAVRFVILNSLAPVSLRRDWYYRGTHSYFLPRFAILRMALNIKRPAEFIGGF